MSNFTTSAGAGSGTEEGETTSHTDYYSMLGVTKTATKEEIRKAFKRLAVTFHPDKWQGDEEQRGVAQARFKEIKEAYEVLHNDNLREVYDSFGAEAAKKQMSMQVGNVKPTNQEFLRDMFRMRRAQHQDYILRRVDHTGKFMVFLWPKNTRKSDYSPMLGPISIRQYIKFPLSAVSFLRLGFNATIHKQSSSGAVKMFGHHAITTAMALVWSLKMSYSSLSAKFTVFRDIFPGLTAGLGISISRSSNPSLNLLLANRNDGGKGAWDTSMELKVGSSEPSLLLSLGTRFDHHDVKWPLQASLELKRQSMKLDLGTHYRLSDRSIIHLQAGAQVDMVLIEEMQPGGLKRHSKPQTDFSWWIAGEAERTISQLTKAYIGFSISSSGVYLTPGFVRYGQSFGVPLLISPSPTIRSSLLAIFTPFVLGLFLEALILEPRRRRKKIIQAEKRRRQQEEQVAAAKARAQADCRLMTDEVNRKRENEEARGGLVILQAFYGRHPQAADAEASLDLDSEDEDRSDRVDVTLPLQYMVQNSQLQIASGTSKASFIGFYDPIPDEDKWIEVVYLYRQKTHHVLASDTDSLRLPLKSHQMDI